jgi:hypothetical protein
MGGGGGGKNGGSSSEAARARADEEDRQKGIRGGTARINGIFDGTGSGLVNPNAIDPTATYYDANGAVFDPSGRMQKLGGGNSGGGGGLFGTGGGQSGGNDADLKQQAYAQAAGEGQLFSGRSGGFNDDFFAGRKQAYLDYANPQLQDQYADAQKQLTFSLARSGNLDSSARAAQESDLSKLYAQRSREIGDQALQQETSARNSVEDARANLITTLNATGDAEGAANSALARASALSQQPAFDPLGNLFVDFTGALGQQAAQERAEAISGGTYKSPYNTGLFGVKNAVKVS